MTAFLSSNTVAAWLTAFWPSGRMGGMGADGNDAEGWDGNGWEGWKGKGAKSYHFCYRERNKR